MKTKSKIKTVDRKVVFWEGKEEIVSEKIFLEHKAIAEVFNKFFVSIVPNLKMSAHHVMILVSLPLMTKFQALSISLRII